MKTQLILFLAAALSAAAVESTTVFRGGDGGYGGIRIPALLVAKDATVLAFAEGRVTLSDQAANDIILRRSTDGGRTWLPLQKLADLGQDSLNNPCPVLDARSGRIHLFFQRYPAHVHEFGKMPADCTSSNTVRNFVMTSDDHGATWSAPRDNTCEVKRPEGVTTLASGPGFGIQIQRGPHAGRLIIPFNEGPAGRWRVYAAYSDDAGARWRYGEAAPGSLLTNAQGKVESHGNEVQMVERADGSLLLNTRSQTGPRVCRQAVSTDGGATWSPLRQVPELFDAPCMASTLALDAGRLLLFSGPTEGKRPAGRLFHSRDGGDTWSEGPVLQPGPFAYSCLAELLPRPDDRSAHRPPNRPVETLHATSLQDLRSSAHGMTEGAVGCLYETGEKGCYERIDFARFERAWATTVVKRVRVACIGDSITWGAGITNRARDSYPAVLQRLLGDGYEVRNFGHNGRTVLKDAVNGDNRGYVNQAVFREAVAFRPDIVVCNLGINDISDFAWNLFPADAQQTNAFTTSFVRDYAEILAGFTRGAAKPRLVIWSPLCPLFEGQRYFGSSRYGAIQSALRAVARVTGATEIDAHTLFTPADRGAAFFPDKLHPNEAGAERVAQRVAAALK